MKTKPVLVVASALALSILLCSVAVSAHPHVRAIHFARGATSTTVLGRLNGHNDQEYFSFRARKGQHAKIEITGNHASAGIVVFPDRSQSGGPGGVIFDGDIPASGTSRIRVFESNMANAWKGVFRLRLSIK